MNLVLFILSTSRFVCSIASLAVPDSEPSNGKEWKDQARTSLDYILAKKNRSTKAKNVILFIGDGMDATTITAARILKGQEKGNSGPEDALRWDDFDHVALSKTYNTDEQVPDSAGTATAYVGGAKTRAGVIGYDENVVRGDCSTQAEGHRLESFLAAGSRLGLVSGVVTTTRITHASPAATYAFASERDWESTAEDDCPDIAKQLVHNDHGIRLFLGGGRREFFPSDVDDLDASLAKKGKRKDGKDLVEEWKKKQNDDGFSPKFVWNKGQLDALEMSPTDSVLGLFAHSHLSYAKRRDDTKEPSLAEMTSFAIDFLVKAGKEDGKGFLLFVEAGRIDHAHHDSRAQDALYDTLALDDAVSAAQSLTDSASTLIVVTADHGHVFSFAGYQSRSNPIFHAADLKNGSDDLPYSSLLYANGPGHRNRSFESDETMSHLDYVQISPVPMKDETHGGADVAVYAHGPFAHLFSGVLQQNVIPHAIAYAACIGGFGGLTVEGLDHCRDAGADASVERKVDAGLIVALVVIGLLTLALVGMFCYIWADKAKAKKKGSESPVTYSQTVEP